MATNLMQLRRLVRSRIGVPLDDDFMPDNVLDDHINLALQTIDAEAHWPWADIINDQSEISPDWPDIAYPPSWTATRAVIYEGRELANVAPADLLRYTDSSDVPTVWCPMDRAIWIRPKVNAAIMVTHYYYAEATWLVGDRDTPALPGKYTGAIVAKAAELLSQRESSGADASRHGAEYKDWITRMKRDMRRATPPARTRVRPGSWV